MFSYSGCEMTWRRWSAGAAARASLLFTLVLYNAMYANADRFEEISAEFRLIDVVVVIGTGCQDTSFFGHGFTYYGAAGSSRPPQDHAAYDQAGPPACAAEPPAHLDPGLYVDRPAHPRSLPTVHRGRPAVRPAGEGRGGRPRSSSTVGPGVHGLRGGEPQLRVRPQGEGGPLAQGACRGRHPGQHPRHPLVLPGSRVFPRRELGQAGHGQVHYCFDLLTLAEPDSVPERGPALAHIMAMYMSQALKAMEATRPRGPPPRGVMERALQAQLRSLQKKPD